MHRRTLARALTATAVGATLALGGTAAWAATPDSPATDCQSARDAVTAAQHTFDADLAKAVSRAQDLGVNQANIAKAKDILGDNSTTEDQKRAAFTELGKAIQANGTAKGANLGDLGLALDVLHAHTALTDAIHHRGDVCPATDPAPAAADGSGDSATDGADQGSDVHTAPKTTATAPNVTINGDVNTDNSVGKDSTPAPSAGHQVTKTPKGSVDTGRW